ncbi:MAG: septal ring lytic transglycosylase RlpA family protein, partial [Okeania sp. SIO2D1]|nr:septal ring lytic transglycosylase RlpA family protein [Okeania sp. SIO2D1]
EELLSQPDFEPSDLEPTIVDGKPAGVAKGKILFKIGQDMLTEEELSPELLAIKWINNLRLALNARPLELVEAQEKMHDLVPTSNSIQGLASWYGPYFHGRLTANGESYNQLAMTAAHPSLPFNTYLRVTNLDNDDSVIVRINDRGPYIPPRSLDLSLGAARCLNSEHSGVIPYKAEILESASDPKGEEDI